MRIFRVVAVGTLCMFVACAFAAEIDLGAPQVPRVEVKVNGENERRNIFTIVTKGLSKDNKYVKSVTLNGRPIANWKIRHEQIMAGGQLEFEMVRCP